MKKFRLHVMAGLLALVMLSAWAMPADAAYYWTQKYARFSAVAGETVTTGQVVLIKDADGLVYKADSNDAALRPAVGVIGMGGTAGQSVEVVIFGILSGFTGLTESGPGYLSETAALITQSAPAYSQQVGIAISATAYLINCQNYFDSSSLTVLGTLSGATPLVFEGATADAHETTIAVVDPTADRTVQIPNKTGYLRMDTAPSAAASALTPAAAVTLTVGTSTVYTLTPNDNEDSTITFSGAGTFGDEITIIITTTGTGDEVITFHATLVSSTGTLTAGTDAGKYYVIRFISNGTRWFEVSRTAVQA